MADGPICINPSSQSGLVALEQFLTDMAIQFVADYFDSPIISVLLIIVENFANGYEQNGIYGALQMMLGLNPEGMWAGAATINWVQDGAESYNITNTDMKPRVRDGLIRAYYMLANHSPTGPMWGKYLTFGPAGATETVWKASGFVSIPGLEAVLPLVIAPPPWDDPISPDAYQAKYGHPVPTADQLAAFMISPGTPNYATYKGAFAGVLNPEDKIAAEFFQAYQGWWTVCGQHYPPPPAPPTCPPGYQWDQTTQKCVPIPPPPPPPPPPSSGNDDEILDLQNTLHTDLASIYTLLTHLVPGQPGWDPAACCQQLNLKLSTLVSTVTTIALAVQKIGAGGSPVDLTPVLTVLAQILAGITQIAAELAAPPAPIPVEVTVKCDCGDSPDLKRIADSYAAADALLPMVKNVVSEMVKIGTIDPDLGQVVLSS